MTANTMSLRHFGHGAVVALGASWSMTAFCRAGIKNPVHPVRARAIRQSISRRNPRLDRGLAPERENSTEPVARPRPPAPGPIGWICQRTFVDRKASASDALRQSCPETLKLGDPSIDPLRPFCRKARPVRAGGNAIGRKPGELHADFFERQPDPLRKDNERNATQRGSRIAPMPGASPHRRNQPAFLVEPQG